MNNGQGSQIYYLKLQPNHLKINEVLTSIAYSSSIPLFKMEKNFKDDVYENN
jgi:hypothetical protein